MSSVPDWAHPVEMLRTYAYLYDTMDTPLRTQLSPDIWRLVYDCPAARPRAVNWSSGSTTYKRVHLLPNEANQDDMYRERLDELERNNEGLDDEILGEMLKRQRHAIAELNHAIDVGSKMHFAAPVKSLQPSVRMLFEVQKDGFSCSVHAFNNLARAVVLEPPDMFSAMECTMALEQKHATPEDVMLAALREGIFMIQIRLTDVDDTMPLGGLELPKTEHFASLLRAAGGMIIYKPPTIRGVGHYVTLVQTPAQQWAIYDSLADNIVALADSAAETVSLYIAECSRIHIRPGETAYEARREADKFGVLDIGQSQQFIGLLPISLACLWQTETASEDMGRSLLVRTLLRRTLSSWRCEKFINQYGCYDQMVPAAISPCAIEELGTTINYQVPAEGTGVPQCRCDGYEYSNVASFVATRHAMSRSLSNHADEMMREIQAQNYMGCLPILQQLRSYIRDNSGCLFTGADDTLYEWPADKLRCTGRFNRTHMSNRRWLRLMTLMLVGGALAEQIERDGEVTDDVFSIISLFCCAAYQNLTVFGVEVPPHIADFFEQIKPHEARVDLLPSYCIPQHIGYMLTDVDEEARHLYGSQSYDVSLWLLRAAQKLGTFTLEPHLVDAFANTSNHADNFKPDYDSQALLVELMRCTLFQLPLAGKDFGLVRKELREQWCFETETLAEHNYACAAEFRRLVAENADVLHLSDSDALELIDIVAFDATYLFDRTRQRQASNDDSRPRCLERAAMGGFVQIHRTEFGALAFDDDKRPPALNNLDRVSMPDVPGDWRTAHVRLEKTARLAVVPISHLPTDRLDEQSWSYQPNLKRYRHSNLTDAS